jgi:hypothetical protein
MKRAKRSDGGKRGRVIFYLPAEIVEELQGIADSKGVSLSNLIGEDWVMRLLRIYRKQKAGAQGNKPPKAPKSKADKFGLAPDAE